MHDEKMIGSGNDEEFLDIKIIVNKRRPQKKQKSVYEDKFRTEIPEDFLALFAD